MQTLRRGSVGPSVRELQQKLNQVLKPLPPLVVDGIFGHKTGAAVRAFQLKAKPQGRQKPHQPLD